MTLTHAATIGAVAPRSARWLPRTAALASVMCLVAHVALLVVTGGSMLTLTLPMLVLSAVCATCATRSLRRGSSGVELSVMLLTGVAMAAVHLTLAPMHEPGTHAAVPTSTDLLMHGGLTAALVVELVAAVVVAGRLRR